MLRFLHIADVHLGMRCTRFSREALAKVREARFEALRNVRRLVVGTDPRVQFVVIAGDLFDDMNVTQSLAERAFELLREFPVPVFVIPGNHDPLQAGAVWDLEPWSRADEQSPVRVLRERAQVAIRPDVTLFPCPVFRKTSLENPTAWIRDFPRDKSAQAFRIGIAHGSVMDRPHLPQDDHPISPAAPSELQLDYLALGHWHIVKDYVDVAGHTRMAYPGVPEPMRFHQGVGSGWRAYSTGGVRDEFLDVGPGSATLVTIDQPGAPPQIERREVGYLVWLDRKITLNAPDDVVRLIREVTEAPDKSRTLLRLQLEGTLPIASMVKLDELRSELASYVVGDIEDSLVMVPTDDEVRRVIGGGVLPQVFEQLRDQTRNTDPAQSSVAQRAIQLLYRLAANV